MATLISKRYVVGTAVALGLTGVVGLGLVIGLLHRNLEATRSSLDTMQARTSAQEQELSELRSEVGDVEKEVGDVRDAGATERRALERQLRARGDRGSKQLSQKLAQLQNRVKELQAAAEEHKRLLSAAQSDENAEVRYRELMSPTVRVNARHEVGSGTILLSRRVRKRRVRTYILTAWHIVQDEEGESELDIDFYKAGEEIRNEPAKILARDEELDLALLEVRGRHQYPHQARLPNRADLPKVPMFSKVYAIGCPLGYSPLPTSGELTHKDKELDGNRYWMVNAPTIFGNSGGGIYVAETRTMVGVLSRISAYKNMIDVAVPHMGLVTPMNKIYDWLDDTRYGFVYKDRLKHQAKRAKTLAASKKKQRKQKKGKPKK